MAEAGAVGAITHIAGVVVHAGSMLRQRCGWCGAVLIHEDLTRVMVLTDDVSRASVPTWAPGSLVALDGGASWMVEREDGEAPANACMRLDPEVTR